MRSNNPIDYTERELRAEIENGARLVRYPYCISIFALTLRKTTRTYLISAGHDDAAYRSKWALISFFFGWWCFPWGPIYTPQVIWRTLRGGIDITEHWRRFYADVLVTEKEIQKNPTQNAATTSTAAATSSPNAGTQTLRDESQNAGPKKHSYTRDLLKVGGIVAAILALLYVGISSWIVFSKRPVALVNGLDIPYEITIDGERYTFPPAGQKPVIILKKFAGRYEIRATFPNAQTYTETFEVQSIPFWRALNTPRRGTVINPDKLALIYQETIVYKTRTNSITDITSAPKPRLFLNQSVVSLPIIDYFFEDPEDTIEVKNQTNATRTHMDVLYNLNSFQKKEALRAYGNPWEVMTYNEQARRMLGNVW